MEKSSCPTLQRPSRVIQYTSYRLSQKLSQITGTSSQLAFVIKCGVGEPGAAVFPSRQSRGQDPSWSSIFCRPGEAGSASDRGSLWVTGSCSRLDPNPPELLAGQPCSWVPYCMCVSPDRSQSRSHLSSPK